MQALDLDSLVSRPSWDWLVEVAIRLSVVIEVIDAHNVPVCPVGSTLDAAAVRTMLMSGEPAIRTAMSDVLRSRRPVPLIIESLHVVCFRLALGGMLLLARKPNPDETFDDCREDLESIGSWLTGAVDASLAQPTAISVEGYRIVSFRRILREATARGSFRGVVVAFVEALNVWNDIAVRVYVAGATEGFVEYGSSMAHASSSSVALDETLVPRSGRMVRVSRADVERVGVMTDPGDTLIHRLLIGTDTVWVLVFSGLITDAAQVRVRVYTDILRESLNEILTTTTSRVVAELSRRHIPLNEPVSTAAETALEQLAAAIGGRQAALAVTTRAGRQALGVGHADLLTSLDRPRSSQLVVRSSDAGGVMTVVVEREHAAFTAFEREIAEAGMTAMQPWIEAALPRSTDIERRCHSRPIDLVFDQLATDAVTSGHHASVVVLAVDEEALCPGLLPSWVARIRGLLRAGDRAGLLNDREIAVLLYGASADQAALVSARLNQLVQSVGGSKGVVQPTIRMMTRGPDAPFEGSLVGAARTARALMS